MENPDEIFTEPWAMQWEELRDSNGERASKEFIQHIEEKWAGVKRHIPELEEAHRCIEDGLSVVQEALKRMSRAQDEVQMIERASAKAEKEIEGKKRAVKILEEIIDWVCMPKKMLQAMEEPWLDNPKELYTLEQALDRAVRAEKITNKNLLSVPAIQEGLKRIKKASDLFLKESQKYLVNLCTGNKKEAELHEGLSRYNAVIKYLDRKGCIKNVVDAYIKGAEKIYRKQTHKKNQETLLLFRKTVSLDKNEIEKVYETVCEIVEWIYSLVEREEVFLSEVLLPQKKQEHFSLLTKVFRGAVEEMQQGLEHLYKAGWCIIVINLLSRESKWNGSNNNTISQPNQPNQPNESTKTPSKRTKRCVRNMVNDIANGIKNVLVGLKKRYMVEAKKQIIKAYAKEGTLDLDKTFFDIVEYCELPDINTEVALLNLEHSKRIRSLKEKLIEMVKRICIISAMHEFFMEEKNRFSISLNEQFEEEIEKATKDLMYIAEEKVFEKEKLASIIKRVNEVSGLLTKIEGPVGFRINIAFKDMVLSKANFHQRNEIAKILTMDRE